MMSYNSVFRFDSLSPCDIGNHLFFFFFSFFYLLSGGGGYNNIFIWWPGSTPHTDPYKTIYRKAELLKVHSLLLPNYFYCLHMSYINLKKTHFLQLMFVVDLYLLNNEHVYLVSYFCGSIFTLYKLRYNFLHMVPKLIKLYYYKTVRSLFMKICCEFEISWSGFKIHIMFMILLSSFMILITITTHPCFHPCI